jgi:hypothetical protein
LPTADQARLRGDEIEVLFVADPPRPLWHWTSPASISVRILRRARGVPGQIRSPGGNG